MNDKKKSHGWLWTLGVVVVLGGIFVIWGVSSQQAANNRDDRVNQLVNVND